MVPRDRKERESLSDSGPMPKGLRKEDDLGVSQGGSKEWRPVFIDYCL